MSVNKVILVGRLGKDPETRYTGSGQAVCNLSVATDESYKDRTGNRQKRTEWHRVVLWAKLAEIAQQYLKKGQMVYIEGRIQSRQWEDKTTSQKRTSFEIVGTTMKMLSSRGDSMAAGAGMGAPGGGGGGSFETEGPVADDTMASGPEISDEDIPF